MGRSEFIDELKARVGDVQDHGNGRVSFAFMPEFGRCVGQAFRIGYEIPIDYPASPPSGVHVLPRIFPNCPGTKHPSDGISDSPLGPEWHFWSRSMPHWKETKRSVKDVLDHLWRLFDTL